MEPQQNNNPYRPNALPPQPQVPPPPPQPLPQPPPDPLLGAPFSSPNGQPFSPQPPQRKKNTGMWVAIIAAAVIVIAGAVVAVLLLTKSKDHKATSNGGSSGQTSQNSSSTDDRLEAQAYEMPSAHVKIRPPKGWAVTPNPDPNEPQQIVQFAATIKDNSGQDVHPAAMRLVFVEDTETHQNISIGSLMTAAEDGAMPTASQSLTVDGAQAGLVEFPSTNSRGEAIKNMALGVIKGSRAWVGACAMAAID